MRFLVDTNLPRALKRWIATKGHDCEHVLDLALGQADDLDVWRYAAANGAVIVSKDEDFADLVRQSQAGPSVLWVRTGNGTNRQLISYFEPLWSMIGARLAAGERLVEVR